MYDAISRLQPKQGREQDVIALLEEWNRDRGAQVQRARAYWDAVHPYSAGGAYVNLMMEEGQCTRAAYCDNYGRLARVKAQYDLTNLCHINQNITPAR